jgi:tRNA(Arg) A34 adenosine deaminase TadA
MKHSDLVEIACDQAKKSSHSKFHHGCVLVKNGKVLSTGYNRDTFRGRPSEHAEEAALKDVSDKDARGSTMVVVRVRKDNTLGMSLPCHRCMSILAKRGVNKIFYSCTDKIDVSRCRNIHMEKVF